MRTPENDTTEEGAHRDRLPRRRRVRRGRRSSTIYAVLCAAEEANTKRRAVRNEVHRSRARASFPAAGRLRHVLILPMRPRRIRHPAPHLRRMVYPMSASCRRCGSRYILRTAFEDRGSKFARVPVIHRVGRLVTSTRKTEPAPARAAASSDGARASGLASFPLYGLTKNWCATYWPADPRAQLLDAQVANLNRTHSTDTAGGSPPRTRPRTAAAPPDGAHPAPLAVQRLEPLRDARGGCVSYSTGGGGRRRRADPPNTRGIRGDGGGHRQRRRRRLASAADAGGGAGGSATHASRAPRARGASMGAPRASEGARVVGGALSVGGADANFGAL